LAEEVRIAATAGTDLELIQIVDAALAESARRSGEWLVCRPGCCECCMGPFSITALDAARLRRGLKDLESADPERAARVRARALAYSGGDDEACPALDSPSGTCDLYAARPITCRVFGPPVRCGSEAVGICELCYHGATGDEITACEVEIDPEGLEARLLEQLGQGETTVAAALCKE
jgi:Fe-S-cluster containining protein